MAVRGTGRNAGLRIVLGRVWSEESKEAVVSPEE